MLEQGDRSQRDELSAIWARLAAFLELHATVALYTAVVIGTHLTR
jgi:hypothetical protein